MQYVNTALINGFETVVTVLPLDAVPGFNPDIAPQSNAYIVDNIVQVGWVLQNDIFVAFSS